MTILENAKNNIRRLWAQSEARPVATVREVEALRLELDRLWPYAAREREVGRTETRITLVKVRQGRRSGREVAVVYNCAVGDIIVERRVQKDNLEYVTERELYRDGGVLLEEVGGLDAVRFGLEATLTQARLAEDSLAHQGEDFGAYMIKTSQMVDATWEWSRPVEWQGAVRWVWETGTLSQMVRLVRWADAHDKGAPEWFIDTSLDWISRLRQGRLSSRGRLAVSTWLDTSSEPFKARLKEVLMERGAMGEKGELLNT